MDVNRYRQYLLEGVLGMKDFLLMIEEISDSEKKIELSKNEYIKWDMHLQGVVSRPSGVHYEEPAGLGEYEDLLNKIKKLSEKVTNNSSNQNKNNSPCSFCGTKSRLYHFTYNKITKSLQWDWATVPSSDIREVFCNQGCFDRWWETKYPKNKPTSRKPTNKPTNINVEDDDYEQNNYEPNDTTNETCYKCNKNLQAGDEYYYKKNDNKKFCSSDCYDKYYKTEKTELEKKEEVFNAYEAIRKEIFEKTPIVLPEEVSLPPHDALYKLLEQKQKAGQLETYTQQKLEEIRKIRSNKSNNNPTNREREREQNQSLLQYFTSNSIDSIRLDNNKLFIKYNYKAEEEEEEPNSVEFQEIKDYLATTPTKSITKSELESKSKQDSSLDKENEGNNTALYWGIGVVGIVAFILGFIIVKKYRKKY